MPEIEKALVELQKLMEYREQELGIKERFLGLGLTSRKNLCIHPEASKATHGSNVDSNCRNLTASWVRERAKKTDIETCQFFEVSK